MKSSVSQCAEVFSLLKNNATREVKALLGNDSKLLRESSELNQKPVNCITLLQLEKLIFELLLQGNSTAVEISRASIGMTLTQRFSDAFGVKLDRTGYLRNRIRGEKQKKTHPLFGDENMNKAASFLKVGRNHPKLAKWMWCYIYCTFSQEEICKLNVNNPVQPNGHRKDCVYEWLDENATEVHKKHFDEVLTLVQISTSQQEFANMFNRMFSDVYQQEFF